MSRTIKRWVFVLSWTAALTVAASVPILAVERGAVHIGTAPFRARSTLRHPILAIGGDVWLPAGSSAMVISVLGAVHASGRLKDDVVAVGAPVYLNRGAMVERDTLSVGSVVYRGPNVRISGRVGGVIVPWTGTRTPAGAGLPVDLWKDVRLSLAAGLALLLVCTCIAVAFPWQTVLVANHLHGHVLRGVVAGSMGFILFVFLAVPLGLSLFGLPFALLLAVASLSAWLLGLTAFAVTAGRQLARIRRHDAGLLWAVISGMFVLAIALALPVVGPVLVTLAGISGAGSLALTMIDRARPAPAIRVTSSVEDETLPVPAAYIESGRS